MSYPWRVTLALIASFWLLLWPWNQLTQDAGTLLAASLTATAVLLVGGAAHRLAVPWPQLLALLTGGIGLIATVTALAGPAAVLRLPEFFVAGLGYIQSATAPVPANIGVSVIIVGATVLLAVLASALTLPTRQPALGILPLISLYLVPSVILVTSMLFSEFCLLALACVALLWAGSAAPRGSGATKVAALVTTIAIAAASVGVTYAAAQLFPPLEPQRSQEPLQMNDPSLDLKRNLVEGTDDVVLTYQTPTGEGEYLKLATLSSFSRSGFGLSDVRVGTGRFPAVPGSPLGESLTTSVQVGAFRSEWLPVPYAPTAISAPGDWGFALDTLDVMALDRANRTAATENLSYQVTSLKVNADPEMIARASADEAPRRDLTTGTTGLPDNIAALAQEITRDQTTAGGKAQALEAYLRSDRFTYSTASDVGVGDGVDTIEDFLFRSHRGYCEQFAGAMTLMARTLDIPARMAVGFVPGTRTDNGWEVTARDMHTWPELWLDGLGWVAFEPTPSRGDTTGGQASTSTAAPSATAQPTQDTTSPEPAPEESPSQEPTPVEPLPGETGVVELLPWIVAGALVLAAGITVVRLWPSWARARRRARRLAGTGDPRRDTVAAWDEVRDSVTDLKLPWPDGSPRFAAERLLGRLGGDSAAETALRDLAAASERALFDRSETYALAGSWRDEVEIIVAALHATAAQRRGAAPRRAV